MAKKTAARWFLSALFADAMEGKSGSVAVWLSRNKKTTFFDDPQLAADIAQEESQAGDVYVAVGLQPRGLSSSKRAGADDVVGLVAFWLDIDVDDKSKPAAIRDAVSLANGMGLPPSIVVSTGNGIHAYWLFDEPWQLGTAAETSAAKRAVRRWTDKAKTLTNNNWRADSVGDLARIMRVPGTLNHKGETPQAVRLHTPNNKQDPSRYSVEDLIELLPDEDLQAIAEADHAVDITLRESPNIPPEVVRSILKRGKFTATWEYNREDFERQDASRYDMAIANEGVHENWSDQVIADAIIAWRMLNADAVASRTKKTAADVRKKAFRADYIAKTIRLARKDTDPMDALSEKFGRKLTQVIRYRGEESEFCIVFEGNDEKVVLGSTSTLLTRHAVRSRLLEQNIILKVPLKEWDDFIQLILDVATDVDNQDATFAGRMDSWLQEYFKDVMIYGGEVWHEGFLDGMPIIKDGMICLQSSSLIQHLASRKITASVRALCRDLRRYGFSPVPLWYQSEGGTRQQRTYWGRPVDDSMNLFAIRENDIPEK